MKAKEYYDKYGPKIWATIQENKPDVFYKLVGQLFSEILMEAKDISEKRHIDPESGSIIGVFIELNQKWNSICSMFIKDCHIEILERNGFITKIKHDLPWLKEDIEQKERR